MTMGKITEIRTQKKKGRVNVYVNERFSFGISDALLIDFDLFVGKELSEREIKKIKEGNNKSKCLEKSFRLLSVRPRSEKELSEKLSKKFDKQTVNNTLEKLKDYKYLNDEEFTKSWISSRKTGRGKKALFFELKQKGIKKETLEKELGEISHKDELENAFSLVKKKTKYKNLSRNEAFKKVAPFLSRRGFSYEVVKKVINSLYEK
jgi:regulatory protein